MRTVLIADSDAFQRQLIDMLLAVDNHRVLGFETGRRVLEHLQSHVPDLVILDYSLPDINGADLCSKMKKVKRLAHVPVILVTAAHKLELVRGIATAVRADLVLAKPLGDKHLREQVLNLLQRSSRGVLNSLPASLPLTPDPKISSTSIQIDPILEQALAHLSSETVAKKSALDKPSALNTVTPVPLDRDDSLPYTLEVPTTPFQLPTSFPTSERDTPPPLFQDVTRPQETSHGDFSRSDIDSSQSEAANADTQSHTFQGDVFQRSANAALESILGQDVVKNVNDTDSNVFEVFDVDQAMSRNLTPAEQGISEQELLESLQMPLETPSVVQTPNPEHQEPHLRALNVPAPSPDLLEPDVDIEEAEPDDQAYTLGTPAVPTTPELAASFEETVSDFEAELETYRAQVQQLAAENERLRATLLELESGSTLVTSQSYLNMVEELEMLRRLADIHVKQMDSLQRQNQKLMEDAQQAQERRRGIFSFLQPKNQP
jgi:DNA-binding response OmpR family regulator